MKHKTMNMTKDEREIEATKAAITERRSALPGDLLLYVKPNRTKLEVWKERHSVETWYTEGCEPPWIGIHRPSVNSLLEGYEAHISKMSFPELFAGYCRLIDDADMERGGDTELDCCLDIAQHHKLPWLESITQSDCEIK